MSIAGCKYQFLLLSEQLFKKKTKNKTSYTRTHAFGEIVKNSYLSVHIPPSCWVIEFALAFEGNLHFKTFNSTTAERKKSSLITDWRLRDYNTLPVTALLWGWTRLTSNNGGSLPER